MKGETILAIILAAAVALVVILVAFVWFPEKAEPQQPPPSPSIEQQITQDATYTCTRSNNLTECVKGNITFDFEGGQSKLYISFDGNDTTVDCSAYLSKEGNIQRTLQSVMNRPREGHLLAGCKSL